MRRGKYTVYDSNRIEMWEALKDLCLNKDLEIDISETNLSLCRCSEILEELGFDQDSTENYGWGMFFWWTFSHESFPSIVVHGYGYTGSLNIQFAEKDDDVHAGNNVAVPL
jgi:hypothetical protein